MKKAKAMLTMMAGTMTARDDGASTWEASEAPGMAPALKGAAPSAPHHQRAC